MDPIYVTGHQNPDTDSIVSAMAYAALRNAIGDREYVAACLGQVSDETKRVLDRFGFQPPKQITNVYTQIKDLDYDTPPILSSAVTVGRAWTVLQSLKDMASVPVANEDGTLHGMLSREDVAKYHMGLVSSSHLRPVPVFNLLSVLEGKLINDYGSSPDMISGEVSIAISNTPDNLLFNKKESIVVTGNQPDIIQRAIDLGVNCLILCQCQTPAELRMVQTNTSIIVTPYDPYRTVRLIFQSVPVGRVCKSKELISVHQNDRLDDVRELFLQHKGHCYPVLDEDEKVIGVLTRRHLLRPQRKRIVLVDHNEAAQSVPGLDEAEILEIIDHHRLADIQTTSPIYVRNEPVGSTNTIIASMFQERGVFPSAGMAGMMAAAIISDTVMFKSPTCTERDRYMAERMARIANVSLDELGHDIFSASTENRSITELLNSDCKEFHIAGFTFAVAQITCVDSDGMLVHKEEFLQQMIDMKQKKRYSMMLLMLTDVLLEGTQLLYAGGEDIIQEAFGATPKDGLAFLPGVMSRKKQVIPSLSALWG